MMAADAVGCKPGASLLKDSTQSKPGQVRPPRPTVALADYLPTTHELAILVLQGVSTDSAATRVLRHLRRFEIFDTGGVALAVSAARNYRVLRARGRTVRKTIDCLIATFCLERNLALLHCDRDFDAFEELLHLQVVRPSDLSWSRS